MSTRNLINAGMLHCHQSEAYELLSRFCCKQLKFEVDLKVLRNFYLFVWFFKIIIQGHDNKLNTNIKALWSIFASSAFRRPVSYITGPLRH